MLLLWFVLILTVKKKWLEYATAISIIVSLAHCALDIFATRKRVNQGGKYGLEIPANFYFYGHGKTITLAKI